MITLPLKILVATAVMLPSIVHAQQSRSESFYDRNGSFAGSSSIYNNGKNTSAYDRNGRFYGSAIRNSDGSTSFYDRNGHFSGSRSSTTQPR